MLQDGTIDMMKALVEVGPEDDAVVTRANFILNWLAMASIRVEGAASEQHKRTGWHLLVLHS